MTGHDDGRPGDDGVDPTAPARRTRGLVVAGVVGLAAVVGGGYLIIDHLRGEKDNSAAAPIGRIDAIEPSSEAPSATASGPASAAVAPSRTTTTAAKPTPSSADAAKVKKEIQAARDAAAKDGHPVQRPLVAEGVPAEATTRVEKVAGETMRITTAKADLTGQKDQLMAADAGVQVGDARCTSKLRFANGEAARDMPTVLLCWRTSANRSVVTMAVTNNGGRPSPAASVAVIDREWARLS